MIKVLLNTPMAGYEAGREIQVQTDRKGTPIDKFWRRRIRDAATDNCLTIVKSTKPKREKK